eukprot:CAMPEP_0119426290 /NCGR_PEP_ID=MMETSP1335-20130426/36085_1 /TAXON_ID=259385 /ORGANISM="Chrysoculter rhomboideus, Strain RCC1486" /LENGTH=35 /DNA_ID= /DNA_START= /DNA_END= /DNA_ORIENTATION=
MTSNSRVSVLNVAPAARAQCDRAHVQDGRLQRPKL